MGPFDFDGTVLAACLGTFGEAVTYRPGAAPPAAMSGVFDDSYAETKFSGDGVPVTSSKPMLGMRALDFAGPLPCEGELFTVRGALWQVTEVHPDGVGFLKIFLMRAR